MRHHLKAASANRVDDFQTFIGICDLELLLEKDRSLLIGRFDDARNKDIVRRSG